MARLRLDGSSEGSLLIDSSVPSQIYGARRHSRKSRLSRANHNYGGKVNPGILRFRRCLGAAVTFGLGRPRSRLGGADNLGPDVGLVSDDHR